jgi:spermidine dehydrogenase
MARKGRGITRRDFLDGVALAVAAGLSPAQLFAAGPTSPAQPTSPAERTGWRGSAPDSYQAAHALRDGKRFAIDALPVDETWDLVVVGAGISGLAAAHFHRRAHPGARVLVLENHDDFGGHARRNEFVVKRRRLIGYGGSETLQSPHRDWSARALALLGELGIELGSLERAFQRSLYPGLGLSRGVFFKRETFGVDKLVTGDPTRMVADDIPADRTNARPVAAFVGDFPLPAQDRNTLVALYTEKRDVLAAQSAVQQEELLWGISYRDFLLRHWGVSELAAKVFQGRSLDFFALGIDGVSAHDAMNVGYPGFQGLKIELDAQARAELDAPYIHHFPDGNASLARALVRGLIPGAAPGRTLDDLVDAVFDYAKLDAPGAHVRLRLSSTAVALRNAADGGVDIGYVGPAGVRRIRAARAIWAGYGMMLPYVCPDVPEAQRSALAAGVKAPLVYVNVAVRNWKPWVERGVHEITNPMGFFSRLKLDYPVSLGRYRCAMRPDEPIVLHLVHVPALPFAGLDQRTAWRAARAQLYTMSFDQFEAQVRDELTRMLGPGGFDAGRDIAAITVNRWGHGYAYGLNSLYDAEVEPPLAERARQRVGALSIAGSDAAWNAYAHSAIDEAWRAAQEVATRELPAAR